MPAIEATSLPSYEALLAENLLLKQRVTELEAIVSELRALNMTLAARVKELEDQRGKTSRNSSKPPSSDGFKKTKSLRQKSEKASGGQEGHKGKTLEMVSEPAEVVRHFVSCCQDCGKTLAAEALLDLPKRQVFELPALKLIVTEHQAEVKRCSDCGTLNCAAFPAEVSQATQYGASVKGFSQYLLHYQLLPLARTQELFYDLFGHELSQGTLVNNSRRCYERLAGVEQAIKVALGQAQVLHVDETSCMVQGQRQWWHVTSTASLTFYALHPKRGRAALNDIGILADYAGVAVHDAYASYNLYDCHHALCNAHLLRDLRYLQERHEQAWAKDLEELLLEAKTACEAVSPELLSSECQEAFICRYGSIIEQGLAAQGPPAARVKGAKGKQKQSPAKNLLDRLVTRRAEVLRFMTDPLVPFDNNQAERDLRMMKVQQKVSGCFRGEGGQYFSRIRGYISTFRKQGLSIMAGLTSIFTGQPLMPNL